mmetsp:Transcript_8333/g.16123  ORF Transcript_8333/g.16123 Transcript_8333/m.16123 type:complete len:388 (+) Transcript_8333:111-1274(+)|eukprot:scaffold1499_cov170-Amphora_coffeaeformis.AAC.19
MTGYSHSGKKTQSLDKHIMSTTLLCWLWVWTMSIGSVDAWSPNQNIWVAKHTKPCSLLTLASSRNKDSNKASTETSCALRRLGLQGVSVSENGFTVMWGLPNAKQEKVYWPWQVTTPQAGDKRQVTSAQALTLCQLIAGIDLAGSRLPADILAQVTVLTCEKGQHMMMDPEHKNTAERLMADVQKQLRNIRQQWSLSTTEDLTYSDATGWIRARVRLPICTLDQIVVETTGKKNESLQVSFHVQAKGYGSLVLKHVTDEVLGDVFEPLYDDYTFSDETRRAFLTSALSLRYKAPVLMEQPKNEAIFVKDIQQAFPLYQTVQKVQTPSDRVVSRIEKGWEIHQLQAAYQIALKKNDMQAVTKIRAKLDEMEHMEDLPVQADSELDSMQ